MVSNIEIHENTGKGLAYVKIDGKVEGTFKIISREGDHRPFGSMPVHQLEKISDSCVPDQD